MATKPASWAWNSIKLGANAQVRIGYGGFLIPFWENTGSNLIDLIGGSTAFASLAGVAPPTWGTTAEGVSLHFPGVTSRVDFASVAGIGSYVGNTSHTAYCVIRSNNVLTDRWVYGDADSSATNWSHNLKAISSTSWANQLVTGASLSLATTPAPDTTSLFVVCCRYDAGTHYMDIGVNGTNATHNATGAGAMVDGVDLTLGRLGAYGAYWLGEFLLFGISKARWSDTDVATFMAAPFDLITDATPAANDGARVGTQLSQMRRVAG